MHQDSMNSWKVFSASCWLWKHLSWKKLLRCLQEVVVGCWELRWRWWMRQNFVSNLFNVWRAGCVMYSQTLSWRRTGPFLSTNVNCRHCSFWSMSSICWAYFSDVVVLLGFRKLQWIRPVAYYQTVAMTFFWCTFDFGKRFGASCQSNHWAGHCWLLHKIHFSSHVTI